MSLPTRRFGLDSTAEVPVSAHHAVGSSVALRYLGRSTGKVVTRAEHQRYRAGGIDLVLVFEDMGRPDQQGYPGGKADAEFALKQAVGRLGTPLLPPSIRFAADYDPVGNPGAADAYFDGVRAVIPSGRCGPYGNDQMCAHQHARGFRSLWQTYAWSGGRFFSHPDNTVYQYSNDHVVGGVGVDFNYLYGHDFGQWDRTPAPLHVDPAHYGRFYPGPFAWGGYQRMNEREVVKEYDRLRNRPLPFIIAHRARLKMLRAQLKALADRVYFEAHKDRPPSWGAFHRGWRYQGLIHRAQGARVT